jgi:hypothetical protein
MAEETRAHYDPTGPEAVRALTFAHALAPPPFLRFPGFPHAAAL